jgi:hypothetical protein
MALTGTLASTGAPHPDNPDALEDGYPTREPGPSAFGESEDAAAETLLTMDEGKAAKKILELWKEQDEIHSRHHAQCRANARRREGHINVQVVKSKDEDRWEEWTWGAPLPHLNKAATLCRKLASNLHADPAVPQPLPGSSDPEDVDAAEFAGRVLEDVLGPTGINDAKRSREATDLGSTYGSCYRHFRIEPYGRRQAKQIEAHALAQTVDRPFAAPVPRVNPLTQQPYLDPTTGQPIIDLVDQQPPFPLRYVKKPDPPMPGADPMAPPAPQGLTDQRAEAEMEWVPKIVDELLPSTQVRFLPATATFIDDADGVLLAGFRSIADLKRMDPEKMQAIGDDQIAKMQSYRPERPDDFLPGRGKLERAALDGLKGDNRLVFVIVCYYRPCAAYELGAFLVTVGGELTLHRQEWAATMEDGSQEPLEIPVSQYLQLREGKQTKDGAGLMEILGPGNEIQAAQLGSLFEHLDRFNGRKVFVPTSSIARPSDLNNPNTLYLPINPGGVPVVEQIPDFPEASTQLYISAGQEMDHASGLEQAAQGVEDSSVNSGIHAQTIVSQVQAGLSELRTNAIAGSVRSWRIVLQLVRAFYTKPQQLKFEGKDGRMRERRWSRADLGSTTDVRLKPGTMTMLAPAAKVAFTQTLVGMGLIPPDEAGELMRDGLAEISGFKDEPHRLRVRRQLADWEEGPPEGWAPPEPQAQPAMDPATGAPTGQMQLVPGTDPVSGAIWKPVPADELPPVAQIRLLEIAKCMASTAYDRWPDAWRAAIDLEFQHMQQVVAAAMAPPPAPVGPDGKPAQAAA